MMIHSMTIHLKKIKATNKKFNKNLNRGFNSIKISRNNKINRYSFQNNIPIIRNKNKKSILTLINKYQEKKQNYSLIRRKQGFQNCKEFILIYGMIKEMMILHSVQALFHKSIHSLQVIIFLRIQMINSITIEIQTIDNKYQLNNLIKYKNLRLKLQN